MVVAQFQFDIIYKIRKHNSHVNENDRDNLFSEMKENWPQVIIPQSHTLG